MEYFGFISGLVYLILEIKQNKLMWVVGVLCALAYIVVFAQSHLYAAMGLQIYYLSVSIYGFIAWKKSKQQLLSEQKTARETGHPYGSGLGDDSQNGTDMEGESIVYRIIKWKELLLSFVVLSGIFVLLLSVLKNMTGDPMPVTDAMATALSIIATWWLSKSYIHQWFIWVVVNILSVFLFISQALYLTAFLYFIYAVCAVYGFYHWRKKGILLK